MLPEQQDFFGDLHASRTKEKCDALKEKLAGNDGYSDHDSEGGCG